MAKPKIKSEDGPERPILSASAKSRGAIATLFATSSAHQKRDDDSARTRPKYTPRPLPLRVYQDAKLQSSPAKIKTEPINEGIGVAAAPAPAKYREVQPQHDELVERRHASGRHGAQRLPAASWLSSRPVSAPKQTPTLTTTFDTLAKYFRPHSIRFPIDQCPLPACTRHTQRVATMDGFGFGDDHGLDGGQEMSFNGFGAYAGVPGMSCISSAPYADYS
jgi:hypothetical protein